MCLKEPVLLATAAKMRLFQPVVIEKQNKNESQLSRRFPELGTSCMFSIAGAQMSPISFASRAEKGRFFKFSA